MSFPRIAGEKLVALPNERNSTSGTLSTPDSARRVPTPRVHARWSSAAASVTRLQSFICISGAVNAVSERTGQRVVFPCRVLNLAGRSDRLAGVSTPRKCHARTRRTRSGGDLANLGRSRREHPRAKVIAFLFLVALSYFGWPRPPLASTHSARARHGDGALGCVMPGHPFFTPRFPLLRPPMCACTAVVLRGVIRLVLFRQRNRCQNLLRTATK